MNKIKQSNLIKEFIEKDRKDINIRNKIILQYKNLLYWIAHNRFNFCKTFSNLIEKEDLYQENVISFITCLRTYKLNKNNLNTNVNYILLKVYNDTRLRSIRFITGNDSIKTIFHIDKNKLKGKKLKDKIRYTNFLNPIPIENLGISISDFIEDDRINVENSYIKKEKKFDLISYLSDKIKDKRVLKIFILYYFENKSLKEISKFLGMKYPTVATLKRRGLQQLRNYFNKNPSEKDFISNQIF